MTNVNSVQASGGLFVINGTAMDLGTAMLQLNLDRTTQLDQQIALQMQTIQTQNNKLKALNELMSKMNQYKVEGRDDDSSWGGSGSVGADKKSEDFQLSGADGQSRSVDGWMDYFGLNKTDVQYNADKDKRNQEWDANITACKSMIDSLNSDSQLNMTSLQSLINKRNQAFDTATNMLQNDQKSRDNIVRNLAG